MTELVLLENALRGILRPPETYAYYHLPRGPQRAGAPLEMPGGQTALQGSTFCFEAAVWMTQDVPVIVEAVHRKVRDKELAVLLCVVLRRGFGPCVLRQRNSAKISGASSRLGEVSRSHAQRVDLNKRGSPSQDVQEAFTCCWGSVAVDRDTELVA